MKSAFDSDSEGLTARHRPLIDYVGTKPALRDAKKGLIDKAIAVLCVVVMGALCLALYSGLAMRGVI